MQVYTAVYCIHLQHGREIT